MASALRSGLCFALLALSGVVAPGCDSAERTGDPGGVMARAQGESTEFETCASTADCVDALRCLDARCVTAARSRVGDFQAATGRRALAAGDLEGAASAYNDAVTAYEKESLSPPAELLCEQGIALAQAREDAKLAEAAARILHKCVLAVPAASELAQKAYDALATLRDAGLDGELLARSETADLYLTGEAAAPKVRALEVQVSSDGKSTKSSFNSFVEALRTDANQQKFQACWRTAHEAHKVDRLDVTLNVTYRFFLDPDDAARDRADIKVEEVGGLSGAAASSSACVHTIVAAVGTELAKQSRQDTRWKSAIRIQIAEGE